MADIFQTTFWNAFSSMKMCELRLKFYWSLFLKYQLTIFQQWFRCRLVGAKPLSEPLMVRLSTHICVTGSQSAKWRLSTVPYRFKMIQELFRSATKRYNKLHLAIRLISLSGITWVWSTFKFKHRTDISDGLLIWMHVGCSLFLIDLSPLKLSDKYIKRKDIWSS